MKAAKYNKLREQHKKRQEVRKKECIRIGGRTEIGNSEGYL